jgi:cytochrome c-type biogenesis protein CcmH/NrfG
LSGVHLDRVIDDLQQSAKLYPSNYQLYQLMGDAMMRDGRLQGALEAYREAMLKLAT